jgi:LysR family transcriptional regulator, hca operon transcriptional activator
MVDTEDRSLHNGFQTSHEMNWLPRAMQVLRDELKGVHATIDELIERMPARLGISQLEIDYLAEMTGCRPGQ